MKHLTGIAILFILLAAVSCQKSISPTPATTTNTGTTTPTNTGGLSYTNTKNVFVSIQLLAPDNSPLANVPVTFYANAPVNINGDGNDSSVVFITRMSDNNGYISDSVTLPATMDSVLIDASYTGLVRDVKAYINGNNLTAVLGGKNIISGDVVPVSKNISVGTITNGVNGNKGMVYTYMGTYDFSGRPNYLVNPGDVIGNKLLSYINASVPEGKNLGVTHPQYLTDEATGNINVIKQSDVSVTFVSEGATYLNTMGYYTYPTGHAPATVADIDSIHIMLPNASLAGSGGNMHPGDKIKLGNFAAGTSIGFVLLDNAWSYGTGVNTSAVKFYSDTRLNPEADATLKKHSVLLDDAEDNLYMVGFEDIIRTSNQCDNDFNDVVFYVTSGTPDAISNTGVEPIDEPYDTDGDGVSNVFDQYPTDPLRAYNTYYPSKTGMSTIAFEDEWPTTADYDMNDLVVNYHYKFVSNAKNEVVEMYADYAVQAAGATFQNGFGVQFPFSNSIVSQVTGQKLISNYVNLAGNGVEAGQQKAVIIPFDNHQALINNYAGAYFINTKMAMPKVTGDTAHIYMLFNSPISFATLGTAPFNPFLISNGRRGYEVHLPGNAPTDLANTKFFGTQDDNSNAGKTYLAKNGRPWAINFPGAFTYPIEGVDIANAYLHYSDWVNSNGAMYKDWYSNTAADYRNTSNLYTK